MKLIIYWARNGCLYNRITQKGVCHEIIDKNPVHNRSFSGPTFLNQLPNTVQLHSTKPKLSFYEGPPTACGLTEVCNGENFYQLVPHGNKA